MQPTNLKILHLANTAGLSSGGIGDVAHELFRRQRSFGADVHLWFPGDQTLLQEVQHITGGTESYLRAFASRNPRDLWHAARDARQFDLIHQHGIWLPNSLVTLLSGPGVKRIISPHGLLEPERLKYSARKKKIVGMFFENRNLQTADLLAACSAQEVAGLRAYGLENEVAVVPNGVSDDLLDDVADPGLRRTRFRQKYGLAPEGRCFLFLSRLDRIKGADVLLLAIHMCAAKLRQDGWNLIVAGSGDDSYRAELEAIAREFDIEDLVRFIGPVYGEDKLDAYRSADVFTLVSRNENFGIVVAEALAMSVPVLVSDQMPWSHVTKEGCGFEATVDPASICDCLLRFVAMNDAQRNDMGRRGRALAERQFRWDRIAQEYLKIYRRIADRQCLSDGSSEESR